MRPVIVGFTGTQVGCADAQVVALARLLVAVGCEVLHHGDCVGADETAHRVARAMGARVEVHPPRITAKRAWCETVRGDVVHEPDEYLARNRAIVAATEVLVACPREEHGETLRSGTWATVRAARRLGRPMAVVRPSGRVERERWPAAPRGGG